jgi:hypothetical protein
VVSQKITSWAGRLPVSPPVLWTGLAIGAFLAVEAAVHGVVVPLGLGVLADAVLSFLFIIAMAIVVAELTRRHHRTVAGHAARHGKRAIGYGRRQSAAGAGVAGRRGKAVLAWLAAKAGPRWRPVRWPQRLYLALRGEPESPAAEGEPAAEAQPEVTPLVVTRRPDGKPETGADKRFFDLRESGYTGPVNQDGYAVTQLGGTTMSPSRISTEHRAQRAARTGAAGIPSEWGAVVGGTADFEPESDAELLDWMGRQVTGLSAWAESLVDTYEHCTQVIGIDPKASTMLHDVADAAAQAAETMSAAKAKFTAHYELPREFAANGGLMTHDGRWITGDGA